MNACDTNVCASYIVAVSLLGTLRMQIDVVPCSAGPSSVHLGVLKAMSNKSFSAATATTQSYLQLGCFPGQLANKALKEPTTAPQTGLEIIVRVFGGFGLRLFNKHKPWIETTYHGIVTENDDKVLLDPPLIALDKDAPLRYAGEICGFRIHGQNVPFEAVVLDKSTGEGVIRAKDKLDCELAEGAHLHHPSLRLWRRS
ncbi:Calsyntenin-1 [Larimichthys crocea]|uniref:Uncharacterized protein n=1 Tax=Larimichthys crocea TaxID=215358 RepID=A0ACD3RBC7_LARCR|nr:Calsyntenin-1 [Larimichthys crocea]